MSSFTRKQNDIDIDYNSNLNKIEQLENDKRDLLTELSKYKSKPEGKIGYYLILLGLALVLLSISSINYILAFVGVALTCWGALLLYIRPTKFVRKDILDVLITPNLDNLNKIIKALEYDGIPLYISPRNLWGMSNTVIYIPKSKNILIPSDNQLSNEELLIDNPNGMKLIPPGLYLSKLIEDELRINYSMYDLKSFQFDIEKVLVENFEIVESFKMHVAEFHVSVELKGYIFVIPLNENEKLTHTGYLFDPLISAIACIIARSTKQPVMIENYEKIPKDNMIKLKYIIINQENSEL